MSAVTIDLFRFEGAARKLWAFSQMALAHRTLRRIDGLDFYRLCGTGRDFNAPFAPNFGVYALVAVWRGAAEEVPLQGHAARAAESARFSLSPIWARGAWGGRAAFDAPSEGRERASADAAPLAVLTRASIKPSRARRFWRRAPAITRDIAGDPSVLFSIGMGEAPFVRQITFSIWPDVEAMRRFAYRSEAHGAAARAAFDDGWFSEDLFARFAVRSVTGVWNGADAARLLTR